MRTAAGVNPSRVRGEGMLSAGWRNMARSAAGVIPFMIQDTKPGTDLQSPRIACSYPALYISTIETKDMSNSTEPVCTSVKSASKG
jgi:hypothetical protein